MTQFYWLFFSRQVFLGLLWLIMALRGENPVVALGQSAPQSTEFGPNWSAEIYAAHLIRVLAGIRRPGTRLAALAEGLCVASARETPVLVTCFAEEVLRLDAERRRPNARVERLVRRVVVDMVSMWRRLDDTARGAVLGLSPRRLDAAIEEAAGHSDPDRRFSAGLAAVACARPTLARVLISLALDADEAVAKCGERGLVMLSRHSPRRLDAAWSSAGSLVVEHARRFGEAHTSRGLLLASILLTPACVRGRGGAMQSALARWLAEDDSPSLAALRTVLRKSPDPRVRLRAMHWLDWGPVSVSAAARVGRATGVEDHEVCLAQAHVLLNPNRRRAIASSRVVLRAAGGRAAWAEGCPLPRPEALGGMSLEARRGLARWAEALTDDAPTRAAALEHALTDDDAVVRWSAVRVLPTSSLADYCFDGDAAVARAAVLRLSMVGIEPLSCVRSADECDLMRHVHRHPVEAVRLLGRQERERREPWNWRTAGGRLAGRRTLAQDREAFVAEVRSAMREGSRRAEAIMTARALELSSDLEADLAMVARESPTTAEARRASASAAAALGDVRTSLAMETLEACLHHADERVRANAVESLARLAGTMPEVSRGDDALPSVLAELKGDDAHRVRANAIRAMLRAAFGRSDVAARRRSLRSLAEMLRDDRVEHRRAAVWVSDRLTLANRPAWLGDAAVEVAIALDGLACGDQDERLRMRAARCAGRLLQPTREAWRARSAVIHVEQEAARAA